MIGLPDCRTRSGFENLSFDFAQSGLRDAGQYVVIAALPWYPVARIRTGQRPPAGGWELPFASLGNPDSFLEMILIILYSSQGSGTVRICRPSLAFDRGRVPRDI